jgi:signal transduction histidine kinase
VLNLVVNACEAMSSIDVHDRRISIGARFEGASCEVLCEIRDRGTGIASEDIERIFQPFVSTKVQGLGMGLAICRSIIEAHGGRLWAENDANGGAVFTFSARMGS